MKYKISALALGVALIGGAAQAADLPSRKVPPPVYIPPPPAFFWTGFYGGLNLGGGWSANNGAGSGGLLPYTDPRFALTPANLFLLPRGNLANSAGGVVGGGQIGYNYQFGTSFLVGVEADFQGTSIRGGNGANVALYPSPLLPAGGVLTPLAGAGGNVSLPWFGTVRGRVGFLATPTLLLYGTGGFAYGETTAFNFTNTRTGWTAGGGAEWMFMPNWSAKVEYLYTDLRSGGVNGGFGWNFGANREPRFHVVRAGVNYHFNWGAPAPVLARY